LIIFEIDQSWKIDDELAAKCDTADTL